MISFPPCKINLGLNIISKRADGYHDIETCFYPVPWTDILEIVPSKEFSFTSSGTPIPRANDQNLCVKAYQLLQQDFDLPPVSIHLHKIIPTGAGLGGGSSDAAYTLKILNSVFDIQLGTQQLQEYGSKLGSDCSFFIESKPMFGEGRGDLLTAINIDLKGYYLVLVNPNVHVSTAQAYAGVVPQMPPYSSKTILKKPVNQWRHLLSNDFEQSVFKQHPLIGEVKDSLYAQGAAYASMSGSGSTVFGLFAYQVDLKDQYVGMTYWAGNLL
jgi:4-diphosphocytidyl-2-C-methyl-D-erythritol kinase